jgi:hypothetical protein
MLPVPHGGGTKMARISRVCGGELGDFQPLFAQTLETLLI